MNRHYQHYSKHYGAPRKHRGYRGGYRRYSRRHTHLTSNYLPPARHGALAPRQSLHVIGRWEPGRTTLLSVVTEELTQGQAAIVPAGKLPYIVIPDSPKTKFKWIIEAFFNALNEGFISGAAATLDQQGT